MTCGPAARSKATDATERSIAIAIATIDGIETYYETIGSGPPLLMFAPGGFNAVIGNWSALGIYARTRVFEHLAKAFTCIAFDRRESGSSCGRFERLSWPLYAAQGQGLLEHLGFERAHVIGGCTGCSVAAAFVVAYPDKTISATFFWPAGGARYRIKQLTRFATHLAFVQENGLRAVIERASAYDETFAENPRVGPWGNTVRRSTAFAPSYVAIDSSRYLTTVWGMARTLFDRDTVPGAEPEDLMDLDVPGLVIPGHDESHATSAARYLEECLPRAEYWEVPVEAQTEANVPVRILDFLETHTHGDG